MLGKKKKDKRDFETLVSDTIYQIAIDALQQIIETAVPNEDDEGTLEMEMTINAMKQKAQMTLDFVANLSADDEEPKPKVKNQNVYGRK